MEDDSDEMEYIGEDEPEDDPYEAATKLAFTLDLKNSTVEELVILRNLYEKLKSGYAPQERWYIALNRYIIKFINDEIDEKLKNRGKHESSKEPKKGFLPMKSLPPGRPG